MSSPGRAPARGSQPSIVGVIPARWGSSRLPGKPLAPIGGRPMIEHVYRRALRARRLSSVVVATDDERVREAVLSFGGEVAMTRGDHRSGTDRIGELLDGLGAAGVVNIQGDEPLIDPALIDELAGALVAELRLASPRSAGVITAAAPLGGDAGAPSVVKVACDREGYALYFSRAAIPHGGPWLHHVGIYAYSARALRRFISRSPGPLERAERLEQLRFLEYGDRIRVIPVDCAPASVDTPEDLARVRALYLQHIGDRKL